MLIDYRNIYIVDDNENSLFVTRYHLLALFDGINVIEFLTPEKGLEFIFDNVTDRKDLVFLDVNMPTMSGWDFLDYIAENWSQGAINKVDICILTSSTRDQDKKKAELHPLVKHYAEKPFEIAGMKEIVDVILEH